MDLDDPLGRPRHHGGGSAPAKGRIRQVLEDLPLLEKAIGSAVFLGGLGYGALKAIGVL